MGKEESFTRIIKDNEGVIFKITTIYTDNGQDQKDLYQEIVYQLWKSFDSFRNESKISTWMYRIALNTAIGQLKKSKKHSNKTGIDQVVLQQTENYDTEFENRLKMVYEQIHQLISEITGLSESNVGTRISRIKQKLKSRILKK